MRLLVLCGLALLAHCATWYTGKPGAIETRPEPGSEFHFAVTSYGEAGSAGAVPDAEKSVTEILRKTGFTQAVLEKSRLEYQNKGGRAPFVEIACSQSHFFRWRTASAYWALISAGTLGVIPAFGTRDLQIDIALYHFDQAQGAFVTKRSRSYNVTGYQFAGLLALPVAWVSWIADDDGKVIQRAVLDFLKEPVL